MITQLVSLKTEDLIDASNKSPSVIRNAVILPALGLCEQNVTRFRNSGSEIFFAGRGRPSSRRRSPALPQARSYMWALSLGHPRCLPAGSSLENQRHLFGIRRLTFGLVVGASSKGKLYSSILQRHASVPYVHPNEGCEPRICGVPGARRIQP